MLRSMGVSVQNGYEFYEIYGNPCRGIKFRQKASNYDELEELIKKKRAEIVLRSQEMSNKVQDQYEDDSEDGEEKPSPEKEI